MIYFPFHTQKICESHLNHSSDSSQVLLKKQCISVWNHQPESILSINKSDRTKIQRRFIANMTPKVSRGSSNCTHWFKGTNCMTGSQLWNQNQNMCIACFLPREKNTPVLSAKLRWSALSFGWLVSHSPVLHYPLEALFWADESICWNLHQHDWAIIEANIGKWLSMQHRWVCCFPSENQTHPSYSVFPGRPTVGGWLMI